MNPLLVLACGMTVVITGILVLRMHAFLALVIGAFAVSLLTPSEALQSYADTRVAKAECGLQKQLINSSTKLPQLAWLRSLVALAQTSAF